MITEREKLGRLLEEAERAVRLRCRERGKKVGEEHPRWPCSQGKVQEALHRVFESTVRGVLHVPKAGLPSGPCRVESPGWQQPGEVLPYAHSVMNTAPQALDWIMFCEVQRFFDWVDFVPAGDRR